MGTHKKRSHQAKFPVRDLAICNTCPRCRRYFKDDKPLECLKKHMIKSVNRGDCPNPYEVAFPPKQGQLRTHKCPQCDEEIFDREEMLTHLGEHMKELSEAMKLQLG